MVSSFVDSFFIPPTFTRKKNKQHGVHVCLEQSVICSSQASSATLLWRDLSTQWYECQFFIAAVQHLQLEKWHVFSIIVVAAKSHTKWGCLFILIPLIPLIPLIFNIPASSISNGTRFNMFHAITSCRGTSFEPAAQPRIRPAKWEDLSPESSDGLPSQLTWIWNLDVEITPSRKRKLLICRDANPVKIRNKKCHMNNEHPQSSTVLPFIPPRLNLGALQELTGTPVCQPSIFGTCFNHPPCIQNSNHVGIHDRLQAMSHHQHSTIFELLLKCLESGDAGSVLGMLQRFFLVCCFPICDAKHVASYVSQELCFSAICLGRLNHPHLCTYNFVMTCLRISLTYMYLLYNIALYI